MLHHLFLLHTHTTPPFPLTWLSHAPHNANSLPANAHAGSSKWKPPDANRTAFPHAIPPMLPLTPHAASVDTPPPVFLPHRVNAPHLPELCPDAVPTPLCRLSLA